MPRLLVENRGARIEVGNATLESANSNLGKGWKGKMMENSQMVLNMILKWILFEKNETFPHKVIKLH